MRKRGLSLYSRSRKYKIVCIVHFAQIFFFCAFCAIVFYNFPLQLHILIASLYNHIFMYDITTSLWRQRSLNVSGLRFETVKISKVVEL